MFHKSKLFLDNRSLTTNHYLFYLAANGRLDFPFCERFKYGFNSFSNCGIFVLCDESFSEIPGERAEN